MEITIFCEKEGLTAEEKMSIFPGIRVEIQAPPEQADQLMKAVRKALSKMSGWKEV